MKSQDKPIGLSFITDHAFTDADLDAIGSDLTAAADDGVDGVLALQGLEHVLFDARRRIGLTPPRSRLIRPLCYTPRRYGQ